VKPLPQCSVRDCRRRAVERQMYYLHPGIVWLACHVWLCVKHAPWNRKRKVAGVRPDPTKILFCKKCGASIPPREGEGTCKEGCVPHYPPKKEKK